MSRINTNVNSLIAQRIVSQQNLQLTKSLERLSTGLAINRGADDPAGLIVSEKLRSEKAGLYAALANAERAGQVINIAEGGLNEISSLLIEVRSLVSQSTSEAGMSTAEKEANQLQIDAILQTIDRIASTTSFQGTKLLNGGFDFNVDAVHTSVEDYQINGAKIMAGMTQDVSFMITQSAQHAGLVLSSFDAYIRLNNDPDARFTFEVAGSKGSQEFSFASATALDDVASVINNFKGVTGVSAVVSSISELVFKSIEYGSTQFVSVQVTEGQDEIQGSGFYSLNATDENVLDTGSQTTFENATTAIRDEGQDIIANINGVSARGKGRTAAIRTGMLDISLTLTSGGAQKLGGLDALTITGGGAIFNLGPTIDINNQVRLGIRNVATRNLGSMLAGGFLNDLGIGNAANLINGNLETAEAVVTEAIDHVNTLRSRLGAFQKFTIGSTINTLGIALENTNAAESIIRDTDFAAETAELTRAQILVAAASHVLSISNAQSRQVLTLLS